MTKLSHLDEKGAARMVDISGKDVTEREAVAEAVIALSAEAFEAVASGGAPKGDVLAAARIAGIMAAKKTPELIPLCHTIPLAKAEIEFEMLAERNAVRILTTMKTAAQTGVEMEALTAAAIAALTIYDMTKALDKSAIIESVRLLTKSGGKSGRFAARPSAPSARRRSAPTALMNEVIAPVPRPDATGRREALRAFMVSRHLHATEWARQADVPSSQIYAFLTGRLRDLPQDSAERLARAANVRIEDLFR